MRNVLICVALAACGGGNKTPETTPAAASLLDCTKVADHVAGVFATGQTRPGVTPAAVKDMVTTRCNADKWSDETKQCLYSSKATADARACAAGMTDQQREAIRTQARALRQASGPAAEDDQTADWVKHVVEEPAPKPAPK